MQYTGTLHVHRAARQFNFQTPWQFGTFYTPVVLVQSACSVLYTHMGMVSIRIPVLASIPTIMETDRADISTSAEVDLNSAKYPSTP